MTAMSSATRRDLIRYSALAATAASYSRILGANDVVGIGIIGLGNISRGHLAEYTERAESQITAVCDIYAPRLDAGVTKTKAKGYRNYKDVLADKNVDAVIICTPDHWHAPMAIEAMRAGKDVDVEKPMSMTVAEAKQMVRVAKETKRILAVDSEHMAHGIWEPARLAVKGGLLGKVLWSQTSRSRNARQPPWEYPIDADASPENLDWEAWLGPAPKVPFSKERYFRWRRYWDYSGGIATDLFVHLCTTIHRLMGTGAPQDVTAVGDLYRWGDSRDVPDTLNAILRYREGFTVTLSSTFNNGSGGTGFEFLGTEGSLAVGARTLTFTAERKTESTKWVTDSWPDELQQAYESANAVRSPRVEPEETTLRGGDATDLHVKNFFAAVRDGTPSVEDVWAGHYAAACAHMVNLSAASGRRVAWDFKARRLMKNQQS